MMNLNNSNYQSQVKKLSKKWRALRLFAVVLILNGCAVEQDFKLSPTEEKELREVLTYDL